MKIENIDPKDLIPAEYNPRKITEKQKQDIKASLKRFGFVDPVLVNQNKERKNIIIGGHQRTLCAIEMGIEKVPVHFLDLTLEREKELNVRLNKSGGDFDFDMLQEFFDTDDYIFSFFVLIN